MSRVGGRSSLKKVDYDSGPPPHNSQEHHPPNTRESEKNGPFGKGGNRKVEENGNVDVTTSVGKECGSFIPKNVVGKVLTQ